MDSRDHFIEDTDIRHGKIVLTWRASAFIESLPNEMTIQEVLHSNTFDTKADIRSYWSVPERLVDIRWLSDRQRGIEQDLEDGSFSSYVKLEYRLYRIVTALGELVDSCGKTIKKFNENLSTQDDNLLSKWQPEEPFLLRCFLEAGEENGTTLSAEDLSQLYEMAKEFSHIHVTDARRKNLQRSAQKLQKDLEKTYGSDLGEPSSLELFHSKERQVTYNRVRDFSKKVYDFLVNQAWREENPALRRLSELEEYIRKVHPDWKPEGTDRWSEHYQKSLWSGLQSLADDACQMINGNGTVGSASSIEDLLKRVDNAIQTLDLSPKEKTNLYNEYIKDKKRCVALLDIQNGPRILAFSGFWDCVDTQVQNTLGCSANNLVAFQNISSYIKVDLAIFSADVVDRIIRCKIDRNLHLIQYGPMRAELPSVFDKKQADSIKKDYSCCERKILAEVASRGGIKTPTDAELYVKFQPCLSCYGALTDWSQANAIRLTIDYPEM